MLNDMSKAISGENGSRNVIPQHVAIIMDGNGRWAQERRKPRLWGHKKGVESVRETVRSAAELGLKVLTLYAFSEENWGRPDDEVAGILSLLNTFIVRERNELDANNVRLTTIGCLQHLPEKTSKKVRETIDILQNNTGLILNIALSYGAKSEICYAMQNIGRDIAAGKVKIEDITPNFVDQYLWTKGLPDPDLLIRTSGEQRISNFLLWQIAYSELYFTPVYWPDFRKEHLLAAIQSFQNRQRRYGLLPEAPSSMPL